MPSGVRVFVDFDGTISLEDTTDVILERFADPEWRTVEAEWLAGRIGSRECLARQIDLVRASREICKLSSTRFRSIRTLPTWSSCAADTACH